MALKKYAPKYKGRTLNWSEMKPIARKSFDNKPLTKTERAKWSAWWKKKRRWR